MGLEVVVGGEDAGADEFLLEDVDEVQQVLGLATADVVDGIRGMGRPSSPVLFSGALRITRTMPSTMSST